MAIPKGWGALGRVIKPDRIDVHVDVHAYVRGSVITGKVRRDEGGEWPDALALKDSTARKGRQAKGSVRLVSSMLFILATLTFLRQIQIAIHLRIN